MALDAVVVVAVVAIVNSGCSVVIHQRRVGVLLHGHGHGCVSRFAVLDVFLILPPPVVPSERAVRAQGCSGQAFLEADGTVGGGCA